MSVPDRLILLVDDSPEDRAALRRLLDRPDYRFADAGTGADGLAACRIAPPDCLILDYDLPDTNGVEFLDQLWPAGVPVFPVVMLTGKGSEGVAVRALKRGAMDYIVKGQYDPADLARTVADAIDKFAARPVLERQRVELEELHRTAQDAARRKERLVLIADDSPEDRETVRRFLSQDPVRTYRFLDEATGEEALAVCRSAGLDCLILDYSMPDMTGLEFLTRLTGGTGITPFPIIMLTGRGDEAVAVQALKKGAQDYLAKGRFTAERLRDTVDQAIARVEARRAQEAQRVRLLERLEQESRRRADELADLHRRKDEFLAMLAHELRNPLAPVRNALFMLRQPAIRPDQQRWAIGVAERQVAHLARLVDDLMDVSRVTRGKVRLQKERVDLRAVAERAAESVRPVADGQRHSLTVRLPADPLPADADPTRVEQVLVNLLTNAAKYTEPGGRIDLHLERDGPDAVFRVADTGVGIPADVLPRVFDLFTQVDRSIDRAQGGLGIGLTLVRSLVELHGGRVEAASPGPGQGSTFTVRLPAGTAAGEAEARQPAPPDATLRTAHARRVLVVEDHRESAAALSQLLALWGHDVRVAHDGAAGLEAVGRFRPDVVLLDLGLPKVNGFEVAERLRAELDGDAPLLVALTGYGQPEDRQRAMAAGFDHHLVKPVEPEVLARMLGGSPGGAGGGPVRRG